MLLFLEIPNYDSREMERKIAKAREHTHEQVSEVSIQ